MNGKFIIGESGIPDDAGLSKIFILDVIDSQSWISPIYDIDSGSEIIYATKDGVGRIKPIGRYKAVDHAIQEPEGFTVDVLDKAVERMLSAMLLSGDILTVDSEISARRKLDTFDTGCDRILTNDHLSVIPKDTGLAICSPEFLGFMYVWGPRDKLATVWGAFLHNIKHSMVLFKI